MPDQPSDASAEGAPAAGAHVDVWSIRPPTATDADTPDEAPNGDEPTGDGAVRPRRRLTSPRTDWRLGGRTVLRWREGLLAVALISLGIGLAAGALVGQLWASPWAAAAATAIIWIGMLVPVGWGFSRSRPIGLLRLRALDVLYGVVLAGLLRATQGALQGLDGSPAPLPSFTRIDGGIPPATVITEVFAPVVVAPFVEELFFRAVVLVSLYTVLRRPFGKIAAGVCALAGSTALFVVAHTMVGAISVDGIVALTLLGVVCGLLVILTGRIWGAILTHLLFNASFVMLGIAGTLWS